MSDYSVQIQIAFGDPLLVSNDSDFDFHSVQATILNPDIFFSSDGVLYTIEADQKVLMARAAQQIPDSNQDSSYLATRSFYEGFSVLITIIVFSVSILTLLMGKSLS